MSSAVSVESAAVQGGIGCCKTAIQELQTAAQKLQQNYRKAGSGGWRDQQYARLGGIVEECSSALTKPISDLEACISNLQKLLSAIQDYSDVSL